MWRRTYLGLAAGASTALAGCSVSAFPGLGSADDTTPFEACPELTEADTTACPDDESGSLAVEQSRDTVAGDAWSLVVAVTNRAAEPYVTNPSAWSLYRKADDGWHHDVPDAQIEPWIELPPGERYAWELSAGADGSDTGDQRVRLDLGPGTYGFAVPFRGPDRVAAVAVFDVAG